MREKDLASEILRHYVEAELNERDVSRPKLALSLGFPERYLAGFLDKNMRQVPSVDKAQAIARALDLEFYIEPPRVFNEAPSVNVDGDDFSLIPEIVKNEDRPEYVSNLAFRKKWLAKMRIEPNLAALVRVADKSMEPTLHRDELVLVDYLRKEQTRGAIFAIDFEEQIQIKRLEWIDGNLLIHSDNPDCATKFRPKDAMNDVRIIGRVVWSARTYPDAYGIPKAP